MVEGAGAEVADELAAANHQAEAFLPCLLAHDIGIRAAIICTAQRNAVFDTA
jgi:hypothetical protein